MSNKVHVSVGIDGRSIPAGGDAGQILQKASNADFDMQWTTPAGGASANIPQPAGTIPVKDSNGGAVGSGVSFARSDHSHELNISTTLSDVKTDGQRSLGVSNAYARVDHIHQSNVDNAIPEELGVAAPGTSSVYARRDHVHKKPDASEIATNGSDVQAELTALTPTDLIVSLLAENWITDSLATDKHTQIITIPNGTINTFIDLRPDYTVMHQMIEDGTSGLFVENENGVFTAIAVGEKPTANLAVAARRTEK